MTTKRDKVVKFLFITSSFPRFASIPIVSSTFFLGPHLLAYFFVLLKKININHFLLIILNINILFYSNLHIISIFYYSLSFLVIFNRIQVSNSLCEKIIKWTLYLIIVSIVADYISPQIIDTIIGSERAIDSRNTTGFLRPVGFTRESSELGIILAILFYKSLTIKNVKLAIGCAITLIFTLSLMGLITLLVVAIITQPIRQSLLFLFSITALVVILYHERLLLILGVFQNLEEIIWVNLSFVKRWIHPVYALVDLFETQNIYEIIFGYGPGNLSDILKERYSNLTLSDLKDGHMLNGLINFYFLYGAWGTIILMSLFLYRYTAGEMLILLFILMNGIPMLSPSVLMMNLKLVK